jgi:2-hydroxychromene-2-carboxylate isomerase
MPQPVLDFWFDFASTYSYPAVMRIAPLAKDAGVAVRFRPFLLGPIFKAQGWDTSPFNLFPAKGQYMWRDLERVCGDLGLAFTKPNPFPQHSLLAARTALAALEQSWGDDFCRAIFHAQFAEGRRIDDPAVIADLVRGLTQEARPVLDRAQADDIKARLRAQTQEAGKRGIFGAPAFTTASGEMFWGNDRLEQALAWAKR